MPEKQKKDRSKTFNNNVPSRDSIGEKVINRRIKIIDSRQQGL